MTFTLTASESHAPGSLHYQLSYGDGTDDANVTNELCTQGPGGPTSQTWTLTHAYAAAGSYAVSVTVAVNCSPDKATAALTVRAIG